MSPEVVVLLLILRSTVANTQPDETGCLYLRISDQYSDCLQNYSSISNLNDVMRRLLEIDFTATDLLSRISSVCNNEEILNTYSRCTARVSNDCPQMTLVIENAVEEDISVFCENGGPSNWLTTIVQNGFIHTHKCTEDRIDSLVIEMVVQCFPVEWGRWNGMDIETAFLYIDTFALEWVRCMINRAPLLPDKNGDGILDCGASWQDLVLTYALRFSSLDELGLSLSEEAMNELLAMKMG